MNRLIISKYLHKVFQTDSEFSEWFGYYNYDTLNHDQTKMLCNRADFDGVEIQKGMTIELGYYDIYSKKWKNIGKTDSFNWQQGAMMQWLPGEGNEYDIIFNSSNNNRLIAKIHNIKSGKTREINWPIYAITPDGKKSIALNLERSYWCRAYHYQSVANDKYNVRVSDDDGIFEIDLMENAIKRIIKIQDIINVDYRSNFDNYKHWIEHIMINPSGTKFVFLHRFSPIDNILSYQTRILIANIDGSNLQVIDDWEKCRWSHFGWKNDNDFTIYCYTANNKLAVYDNLINSTTIDAQNTRYTDILKSLLLKVIKLIPKSIRKKIKGQTSYYQLYTTDSVGNYKLTEEWKNTFFYIDGHPSFTKDGRYMITDTYPDSKQYQSLIIFDTITKKGIVVGKFFASLMGNPASCDLHPKLCNDNKHIVIDTAYENKHKMIVFKINWDKVKKKISR